MSQHEENVAVASLTYRFIRAGVEEETAANAAHYIYVDYLGYGQSTFIKYFKDSLLKRPLHEALMGGFLWSETPEGAGFWGKVHRKLEDSKA